MSWNFIEHFNLLGHIVVGIILPFLFVLTIIVFVHELGHFLVARWCGIKVLVFSVGFGPELVGFNDRYGTRWKISAIPLGGYVKFFGDENVASVPDANAVAAMNTDERRVSFFHQPVAARAAVVAAGPIANFLLAIAIFATIFMLYGKQETTARIDSVLPGSAAETAGFQSGDLVLSIDGKPIATFKVTEDRDNFGNVYRIGRLGLSQTNSPQDVKTRKFGPLGAIEEAAKQTWFVVDQTFAYLGKVVVGRASTDQLGGPLRIAQMSGQAASLGFSMLMNWAGLISVSIGLLNLFPIPLLDGGHLLFYGIEAIRGRPLSDRVQEFGFRIGLALIVMLMIFTVWNDLSHFRSS